ncbi:ribosome silencing factor [Alkalicoccus urumqiensis]|uniref:Ribosomal silencing factor RsfS n=1 Tax=Alkalicoccus urumqiensis TaxID=1548213 RepID=A0A2P6MFQ8_ALKUR|nr:ribosome silencing factor [Alkalicoccus urumqiensis]PRO65080.1 ribosome silencing factor [Alkalicoccus urumqiensis]
MTGEKMLDIAVRAAEEKNASQLTALNMKGVSSIADYFVICHGTSETQVEAIAREIKDKAEEAGVDVKRVEGMREARWVLIDLGDVVVHVFHKEDRDYYQLEKLWGDAPVLRTEEITG